MNAVADTVPAGWPHRAASHIATVGPNRWHYQRMGNGQPMLLLHGSGAATHSWRGLMPLLAEDHDVLAPDLPGHGFTLTSGTGALTLPGMAESLAALLRSVPFMPRVVVGHSAGAAIALQAALSGQISPRIIIGLNAALTPFRGLAGLVFPPMAKLLALNPFTPWVFSRMAGSEGAARRLIEGTGSQIDAEGLAQYAYLLSRPGHVGNALGMMAQWDLEPMLARLGALDLPVHLFVGSDDRAVPPAEAERLASMHAPITVHRIPDLGHLMHEEAPEMIAGMIRSLSTED